MKKLKPQGQTPRKKKSKTREQKKTYRKRPHLQKLRKNNQLAATALRSLVDLRVQIELPGKKFARTVYLAVLPETDRTRAYRSEIKLSLASSKLNINISASDIVALRAASNSFLRLVMVAMKTISVLAPFYTAGTTEKNSITLVRTS